MSRETQTETTAAELQAVFEQRAGTYQLLARLYCKEIDERLLKELRAKRWRVSTGNASVDEGHRLIATYLSRVWENTLTELAADYMRVFYGHGYNSHSAAYPFESVYTSEKRLLMQSARDEVLALYRAAGLKKGDSWKEGEDHIGLELEYMQVLATRTAEALGARDERKAVQLVKMQLNFLREHLSQWVPILARNMEKFAKTDFYVGLAYLTDGFVENDRVLLEEMIVE